MTDDDDEETGGDAAEEALAAVSEAVSGVRLKDFLSWIVAGYVTTGLAITLFGVSHGDLDTAFEVLRSSGTGTMALGIAIRWVPVLLALGMIALLVLSQHRPTQVREMWFVAVLAAPILLVSAIGIALFVLPVLVFGPLLWRKDLEDRESVQAPRLRRGGLSALAVFGGLIVLVLLADDRMWLPSEVIETDTGSVTGYVLTQQDSELVVLRESDRAVVRLASTSVRRRQICSLYYPAPFVERTPLDLINRGGPDYPRCDEVSAQP